MLYVRNFELDDTNFPPGMPTGSYHIEWFLITKIAEKNKVIMRYHFYFRLKQKSFGL